MYKFLQGLIEQNYHELLRLTKELEDQLAFCKRVPADRLAWDRCNRLRLAGEQAKLAHQRAVQIFNLWNKAGKLDLSL